MCKCYVTCIFTFSKSSKISKTCCSLVTGLKSNHLIRCLIKSFTLTFNSFRCGALQLWNFDCTLLIARARISGISWSMLKWLHVGINKKTYFNGNVQHMSKLCWNLNRNSCTETWADTLYGSSDCKLLPTLHDHFAYLNLFLNLPNFLIVSCEISIVILVRFKYTNGISTTQFTIHFNFTWLFYTIFMEFFSQIFENVSNLLHLKCTSIENWNTKKCKSKNRNETHTKANETHKFQTKL